MLVLSRKIGEAIFIGPDVCIEIVDIDADRVRLGIQAPEEIRVFRKELLKETVAINQLAVKTPVVSF